MRRTLALLALALLLLPAAAAQGAAPPRNSVWTVHATVDALVVESYAIVKVVADIGNRGPDPEFPFQVRVPDDAFVTGLTIERDGKVFEARIEPREQARQEYEAQKQAQQTGGLVEKARRSSLYSYLVNVAEFTSVRATLTYERHLSADRGVYELPLEAPVSGFGQDLGATFHAVVLGADGVGAAWSTPAGTVARVEGGYSVDYAVGPRSTDAATPLAVSYTLPPTDGAGALLATTKDGVGYFVHKFRAPADETHMPVDLVLVLDVSGSMNGLKFQQMQDAATQVLQRLRPEDRLHIAFFSSDASAPWPGLRAMTGENRTAAAKEVHDALVAGGTNLESAIKSGFRALDGVDWAAEEGRLPALVLLTDGQPTVGETDRARLRQLAKDANAHGANVFAIAFGSDADWTFIHGVADDGNGVALRVPEGAGAEVDLRRFMETLATPVLKDVRVEYDASAVSYRATAPVLFAGSELVVVGTFDPARTLHATVRAQGPDGARSYAATAPDAVGNASWLPRLVAYQEIRRYQDLVDAEGARQDWVAAETALALRHGFVTDYTSLVVTLDPRPAPESCGGCWTTSSTNATSVMVADQGSADAATLRAYAADPRASTSHGLTSTAPTATTAAPQVGPSVPPAAPAAKVPAPGVALAILAVASALALLPRRR